MTPDPMASILEGVRIVEVAEHTFVPAASALMADWGAEVIKIEHVERGDAMRGLASTGVATITGDVHPLLEHSNRGKRSLAVDLTSDDGHVILRQLVAISDIFLTNKLPSVRDKLHIGVEEIRKSNPRIIYVRGTGQGERGPEADKGSYDSLAFWARSGIAAGLTRPDYGHMVQTPAPGFGDSIGAMTIAGGMMGALYRRERTGEPTIVDVSLLGTGIWAMGQALAVSLLMDIPWMPPSEEDMRRNPLVGSYLTSDGRYVSLCCLQAARYWPEMCRIIGRPELATDPRFTDMPTLLDNAVDATEILTEAISARPLADWKKLLADFSGQWTVAQNTLELAEDPQAVANGYIQECRTASGTPFRLAAAPVQFDETPPVPRRAPEFNEHGDAILHELGYDWDAIVDLKVRGIIA
jgi:crotonobetainyl-CoA:carnitine CoA-transferase CaiB-like acyl-CoA transferase